MNEEDKAASDEKQKPSGVRQFIVMAIVLTIAAVVCAVFIFSEISRIDTSALEPRKIPMPAPVASVIAPAPPLPSSSAEAEDVRTAPANSNTEDAKPVAAPAASPAK